MVFQDHFTIREADRIERWRARYGDALLSARLRGGHMPRDLYLPTRTPGQVLLYLRRNPMPQEAA